MEREPERERERERHPGRPRAAKLALLVACAVAAGAATVAHRARSGAAPREAVRPPEVDAAPDVSRLAPACAPPYPRGWRPDSKLDRRRPVASARPARGRAFRDPHFGTCVVRVTDHAADGLKGFARSDYSRRQAYNADDTRLVVSAHDGSFHLYDVRTRRHLGALPDVSGDAEIQWHPRRPEILYYVPDNGIGMKLLELNVTTKVSRVAADFKARLTARWPAANTAWTKSEGSPSADGRYWAFMVDDEKWHGLGMFTYDLSKDRILATYDFARHGKGRPDHVSMSPSGRYVVASWDDGTVAFPRDLGGAGVVLNRKSEHSDLAIDAAGNDVYVSIDYGADGGPIFMADLATGVRTELVETYLDHTATAMHFSGKAFRRPGWVLVSTYAETGASWQWLHGKIFALELAAAPRSINLAHHHGLYDEYFTEPHATVNRDFTRVLFNSTWDRKSKTDIDAYEIELPANLFGELAAPRAPAAGPAGGVR
jgi:WD40 repeat protein